MSRHRRNRHHTKEAILKEFPEEFDDVFFHKIAVSYDKKIPVLRNIVYKRIKSSIIDRVEKYTDIPLNDSFTLSFPRGEYSDFQWGVIKEELLDYGFDAKLLLKEGKVEEMTVNIERLMNLPETLQDRKDEERDE